MTGNGEGFAGYINYADMAASGSPQLCPVQASDTGHVVSDTAWMSDPDRIVDYGHQSRS